MPRMRAVRPRPKRSGRISLFGVILSVLVGAIVYHQTKGFPDLSAYSPAASSSPVQGEEEGRVEARTPQDASQKNEGPTDATWSSSRTTDVNVEPAANNEAPSTTITADTVEPEKSSISNQDCPTKGSFVPIRDKIVISQQELRDQSREQLASVKGFTFVNYEKHMMNDPGKEHYALLHYLTRNYGDCRHVVDIGTRYVASALALGVTGAPVKTFDIPKSRERFMGFRDKTEDEWQKQVRAMGINITFYNIALNEISAQELKEYMSTWLVVLDTFHKPYTAPFEREFLQRMINDVGFKGIMILDDIHMDQEMEKWWTELKEHADEWGYKAHDLSSIGHFSGTGLLDFSGQDRVSIVD